LAGVASPLNGIESGNQWHAHNAGRGAGVPRNWSGRI